MWWQGRQWPWGITISHYILHRQLLLLAAGDNFWLDLSLDSLLIEKRLDTSPSSWSGGCQGQTLASHLLYPLWLKNLGLFSHYPDIHFHLLTSEKSYPPQTVVRLVLRHTFEMSYIMINEWGELSLGQCRYFPPQQDLCFLDMCKALNVYAPHPPQFI